MLSTIVYWLLLGLATGAAALVLIASLKAFKNVTSNLYSKDKNENSQKKALDLLTQKPNLNLLLQVAEESKEKDNIPFFNGFNNEGYNNWKWFILNPINIGVITSTKEDGSIVVIYYHPLMGAWFDLSIKTIDKNKNEIVHTFTNSKIYTGSSNHFKTKITHHKLMTIPHAIHSINEIKMDNENYTIKKIQNGMENEFITNEYKKGVIATYGTPLNENNVAPLLIQMGSWAYNDDIEKIINNAQEKRIEFLNEISWQELGNQYNKEENILINSYSIINNKIKDIILNLMSENEEIKNIFEKDIQLLNKLEEYEKSINEEKNNQEENVDRLTKETKDIQKRFVMMNVDKFDVIKDAIKNSKKYKILKTSNGLLQSLVIKEQ